MTLSGSDVHHYLIRAHQRVVGDLQSERMDLQTQDAQLTRLARDRGETLASLAQFYLAELTAESVAGTWREIREDVGQILLRKQEHQQRAGDVLAEQQNEQLRWEALLENVDARLEDLLEQQQVLSRQLADELAADPKFASLSDRAATAEAALEQAEGRLSEVQQDAAQKLPAYEKSHLFQYLYDRGLGTPAYAGKGFTKRMDRWVGKLIGYREARQGYDFLTTTPQRMQEIVQEDREAVDTVLEELENQRDKRAESLGLTAVSAELEKVRAERVEVIEGLDSVRLKLDAVRSELTELEDTRGPYYREAVDLFRSVLEKTDMRTLAGRADQTPEVSDDQIVARLQGVQAELENAGDEVSDRHQRVTRLEQQAQELGRLLQQYRAAGYESSRSQFRMTFDIAAALEAFRRGDTSADSIWVDLRRAQVFGPSVMEQVSQVAAHPLTQVLIHAMASAAGSALSEHARRAGSRRVSHQGSRSRTFGNATSRPASRSTSSRPPQSRPSQSRPSGGGAFRTRDYL